MTPKGVLETCLYAEDLKAAKGFYRDILGLEMISEEPGRHIFFRCGSGVFLVFNPKATQQPASKDAIDVPDHGARGAGHAAFAVPERTIADWKEHLETHGILIEREIHWPNGGHSVYFRDPAGNSLEVATPRLWSLDNPSA